MSLTLLSGSLWDLYLNNNFFFFFKPHRVLGEFENQYFISLVLIGFFKYGDNLQLQNVSGMQQ
jgi:hypothetical protein